jgi:hopanoid biosynthesis associated protein HpnK
VKDSQALRSLIVCADDFGLDIAVNEAVEEAHRRGILTATSLMVGGPAAADAVARARRLPQLRVGLHLVLVDGRPVLPAGESGGLVGGDGEFDRNPLRAGLRFFFLPPIRRRLSWEIRAQFEAFRATGLSLDHVDGHKHMQLHPSVARLAIEIGRDYGMTAMRVPAEPAAVLRAAFPGAPYRPPLYRPWAEHLRRRLRRAGIAAADQVFGIAWSGGMTEARVMRLLPHLPEGVSEIYFHPATRRSASLAAAMPGYRLEGELAALLSPAVARRIAELGIALKGYRDLARPL